MPKSISIFQPKQPGNRRDPKMQKGGPFLTGPPFSWFVAFAFAKEIQFIRGVVDKREFPPGNTHDQERKPLTNQTSSLVVLESHE